MGNNEKNGIESESVIYNGFMLINGTINGEDIKIQNFMCQRASL